MCALSFKKVLCVRLGLLSCALAFEEKRGGGRMREEEQQRVQAHPAPFWCFLLFFLFFFQRFFVNYSRLEVRFAASLFSPPVFSLLLAGA